MHINMHMHFIPARNEVTLVYHFASISAPATKHLVIESRSDGSHAISDADDRRPRDDDHASVVDDSEKEDTVANISVPAGASKFTVCRLYIHYS